MGKRITIAIDGPAASGKSTTARLLANKLGYIYIDTGAMYRAATLFILRKNININDEIAVVKTVENCQISIRVNKKKQHTYLNNEDVSHLLRDPSINRVISIISSYAGVRKVLMNQQRVLAADGGVIMDGRDIGTVVLPAAELKIFLIASLKERVSRRLKEINEHGGYSTFGEVKKEIQRRDMLDASRSQAPLKKAVNARELDTSNLTIDQQVEIIFSWVQEKVNTIPGE